MAFREVTMLEVKEVLRLWLLGVPKKGIAAQLGFDVKTVRRYLAVARGRGVDQAHGLAALDDGLVAAVVAATQPGTGRPRGDAWAVCEAHREFIEGHLGHRVRLSKIGKLLRRRGVEIGYDTLRRYAMDQLGFGSGRPTVPVADGEPGQEVQLDTGWMTLLEPDLFGKRRRFKAWIFTAVLSRHRFVYPIFHETTALRDAVPRRRSGVRTVQHRLRRWIPGTRDRRLPPMVRSGPVAGAEGEPGPDPEGALEGIAIIE